VPASHERRRLRGEGTSVANKRFAVTGAALAVTALAVVPALADSQPYQGPGVVAACAGKPVTGTGVDPVEQAEPDAPAFGVGGACFARPDGNASTSITTTVSDSTGAVAYAVQFQDAAGNNSSTTVDVCSSDPTTIDLPTDINTAAVFIFTDDPATAQLVCGTPSVPTTGTADVEWNAPV
jgi:hypothetical protein